MLNLFKPTLFAGLMVILFGCNKNNDPAPVFTNGTAKVTTTGTVANVVGATISDYAINLENIRFRTIPNDPLLPDNTIQVAKLVGPFMLSLVGATPGDLIPSTPLPDATYEVVKFDLVRGKQAPMVGSTIWIKGTIGTTPFEMWHDSEPTWQDNFATNMVVNGNVVNFGIEFTLDGFDFSVATDGDGDGLIEINPNDPDGNNTVADDILAHIKNNFKTTF
ncbi:MAG: hypothetical protein OEW75_04875 [Cyclobacteriaceae bacterium]|nr:hypothetical protein [Cyclobacteriaceae bacterium]